MQISEVRLKKRDGDSEKCNETLDPSFAQIGRELKYVTNDVKTLEGQRKSFHQLENYLRVFDKLSSFGHFVYYH